MGIQGRGPQCCCTATGGGGAGEWGTPTEVTIASGVAVLSGPGWYTLDTEGDAGSDNLTKFEGLSDGDEFVVSPVHDDRTIDAVDGAYIALNRDMTCTMDNTADAMGFQCIDAANNKCRENWRVSGGT